MPDKIRLPENLALYATLPLEECVPHYTHLSPHERLALLAAGADALAAALDGLSEADLDRSPAPGAWTIRQIVNHLADGETIWSIFLRMALGVPDASAQLEWYPGNEAWAGADSVFFRRGRRYVRLSAPGASGPDAAAQLAGLAGRVDERLRAMAPAGGAP